MNRVAILGLRVCLRPTTAICPHRAKYPGRKGWAAVDANNGEILYRAEDIIKGAVLYADQRFYVLSENGWIRLLEARKDKFSTHGEFRLAQADNNAWAHPVILNQRLYLRYQEELFCFDVKANRSAEREN